MDVTLPPYRRRGVTPRPPLPSPGESMIRAPGRITLKEQTNTVRSCHTLNPHRTRTGLWMRWRLAVSHYS